MYVLYDFRYYAVMKEDRKTKEKDIAELKTKCEELTQQVTKLEADCQSYLNTIKNMVSLLLIQRPDSYSSYFYPVV